MKGLHVILKTKVPEQIPSFLFVFAYCNHMLLLFLRVSFFAILPLGSVCRLLPACL